MGWIAWIAVGAIAGFLASIIVGSREGLLMMIVVGIVGSLSPGVPGVRLPPGGPWDRDRCNGLHQS